MSRLLGYHFAYCSLTLLLFLSLKLTAQDTYFNQTNGLRSAPYEVGIHWWTALAKSNKQVNIDTFGMTDAGLPLHVITLSKQGVGFRDIQKDQSVKILINNAIHPGEPDGVDASMLFFEDILKKQHFSKLLDSCIFVCIPYYNIGGAHNINSSSRANQLGPEEYGFRGNAQNLDLNRDFIKCDSRNAITFAKLIQLINPEIYIETHVSNGADYQYTMTYLPTQPDKLLPPLGPYLQNSMIPALEKAMLDLQNEMCPYVNIHNGPLEDRIVAFYDSPRYSTGMLALHGIIGIITETHMLKPFKQRVLATHDFFNSLSFFAYENKAMIKTLYQLQQSKLANALDVVPINWSLDSTRFQNLNFKAYEYAYKPSLVTGAPRLYYDTTKPLTKVVKYYKHMNADMLIKKPSHYILQQGYWQVAERLLANGVKMFQCENDTTLIVTSYQIKHFETVASPYEKHYLHYNTRVDEQVLEWKFRKGDYIIPMNTEKNYFIATVLEPTSPDSYFNWNFFDAILQQKEWFSAYIFEEKAFQLLQENHALKKEFENKLKRDTSFAKQPQDQLLWLYRQSKHYEKEHLRLPVFRIN